MRVQHLVSNTTAPNSGYFHPLFGGQEADLQHHAVKLASGWVLHLAPDSERDSIWLFFSAFRFVRLSFGLSFWACIHAVENSFVIQSCSQ